MLLVVEKNNNMACYRENYFIICVMMYHWSPWQWKLTQTIVIMTLPWKKTKMAALVLVDSTLLGGVLPCHVIAEPPPWFLGCRISQHRGVAGLVYPSDPGTIEAGPCILFPAFSAREVSSGCWQRAQVQLSGSVRPGASELLSVCLASAPHRLDRSGLDGLQ